MEFVSFLRKSPETPFGRPVWAHAKFGVFDAQTKNIHVLRVDDAVEFIAMWGKGRVDVTTLQSLQSELTGEVLASDDVFLTAPVPKPTSVRDGYAFRQHVEAARRSRGLDMIPEYDQFPIFYFTNHLAITGPGDVWVQQKHCERLDIELEVAIVIGRECRNVTADKADDCIFGYTIMNDWSARALQAEEMKMNLGPAKGKDFATSLGPTLVTRDTLKKAGRLEATPKGERFRAKMKAYLNNTQYAEGDVFDMQYTFAEIIERASYGCTLYPGDVIGSGTVGTGCFMELNGSKVTQNLWVKPGDEVVLSIDGLGVLKNRIVLKEYSVGND